MKCTHPRDRQIWGSHPNDLMHEGRSPAERDRIMRTLAQWVEPCECCGYGALDPETLYCLECGDRVAEAGTLPTGAEEF